MVSWSRLLVRYNFLILLPRTSFGVRILNTTCGNLTSLCTATWTKITVTLSRTLAYITIAAFDDRFIHRSGCCSLRCSLRFTPFYAIGWLSFFRDWLECLLFLLENWLRYLYFLFLLLSKKLPEWNCFMRLRCFAGLLDLLINFFVLCGGSQIRIFIHI